MDGIRLGDLYFDVVLNDERMRKQVDELEKRLGNATLNVKMNGDLGKVLSELEKVKTELTSINELWSKFSATGVQMKGVENAKINLEELKKILTDVMGALGKGGGDGSNLPIDSLTALEKQLKQLRTDWGALDAETRKGLGGQDLLAQIDAIASKVGRLRQERDALGRYQGKLDFAASERGKELEQLKQQKAEELELSRLQEKRARLEAQLHVIQGGEITTHQQRVAAEQRQNELLQRKVQLTKRWHDLLQGESAETKTMRNEIANLEYKNKLQERLLQAKREMASIQDGTYANVRGAERQVEVLKELENLKLRTSELRNANVYGTNENQIIATREMNSLLERQVKLAYQLSNMRSAEYQRIMTYEQEIAVMQVRYDLEKKLAVVRQQNALWDTHGKEIAKEEQLLSLKKQRIELEGRLAKVQQELDWLRSGGGKATIAEQERLRMLRETEQLTAKLALAQTTEWQTLQKLRAQWEALTQSQRANTAATNQQASAQNKLAAMMRNVINAANNQNMVLAQLKSYAMNYLSVWGAMHFVSKMAQVTGEFQKQLITLEAIVQSATRGRELFAQINSLAMHSPFTSMQLISYAKQLSAFQIPTKELYDTTKRLSDLSAGLGVDMGRIILAYGQVRTASFLRGQEVRQFTEAGLPLPQMLADQFTKMEGKLVTPGQVFERISKREVPFEMVKKAIMELTDESGKFYNMQEKQAESLAGKIGNLKDAWTLMLYEVGNSKDSWLRRPIEGMTHLLRHTEKLKTLVLSIGAAFAMWKFGAFMRGNVAKTPMGIVGAEANKLLYDQRMRYSFLRREQKYGRLTGADAQEYAAMSQMRAAGYKNALTSNSLRQLQQQGLLSAQSLRKLYLQGNVSVTQLKKFGSQLGMTREQLRKLGMMSSFERSRRALGGTLADGARELGRNTMSTLRGLATDPFTWATALIGGGMWIKGKFDEASSKERNFSQGAQEGAQEVAEVLKEYFKNYDSIVDKIEKGTLPLEEQTSAMSMLSDKFEETSAMPYVQFIKMAGAAGDVNAQLKEGVKLLRAYKNATERIQGYDDISPDSSAFGDDLEKIVSKWSDEFESIRDERQNLYNVVRKYYQTDEQAAKNFAILIDNAIKRHKQYGSLANVDDRMKVLTGLSEQEAAGLTRTYNGDTINILNDRELEGMSCRSWKTTPWKPSRTMWWVPSTWQLFRS